MTYKIGQKVVYPTHGVAIIEQIESRQINGESSEFYLLRLQSNNSIVMVPMQNADDIGLRRLIAVRQCEELFDLLAQDFTTPPADWKDRFKGFMDAMKSGDLFAVAGVLKTLTYLNQLKPLSFREKQMLERARYLIVSELAVVSKKTEAIIVPKVEEALNGACTKHGGLPNGTN